MGPWNSVRGEKDSVLRNKKGTEYLEQGRLKGKNSVRYYCPVRKAPEGREKLVHFPCLSE